MGSCISKPFNEASTQASAVMTTDESTVVLSQPFCSGSGRSDELNFDFRAGKLSLKIPRESKNVRLCATVCTCAGITVVPQNRPPY